MANDEDREVTLVRLKCDHELAMLGLHGTLKGSFAALAAMVIIAVTQVSLDRYVVKDWAFAGMVAAMVVAIALYGAFIFNRALKISAKVGTVTTQADAS